MLAFDPPPCKFLDTPFDNSAIEKYNDVATWENQVHVLDGVRTIKTVHRGFFLKQPGGGRTFYSRSFLLYKQRVLHSEWARRHAFFQVISEDGTTDGVSGGDSRVEAS